MNNFITMRKRKNLTQKELASILGITPNSISQYELGKREPNIEMLKKIAKALNCTVDELINEKKEGS